MRSMTARVAGLVSQAPVHQAFSDVRDVDTTFCCSPYLGGVLPRPIILLNLDARRGQRLS